jgi:AcrR family transcriptional regulator
MRSKTSPSGQESTGSNPKAQSKRSAHSDRVRSGSFTEAARREQIVSGAINVLADRGYNAATLQAIAAELRISKGVISYHFAGKADLLQEVVRSILAQAEAWMIPRVAGAHSIDDALRRYISSNLGFLDAHRPQTVALVEVLSNARDVPGLPESYGKSHHAALSALEDLLARGQASGEFGEFPVRIAAATIRSSIDAATGFLREDPEFDLLAYGDGLLMLIGKAVA